MNPDNPRTTQAELDALPENVKLYIAALEAKVLSSQNQLQNNADELRRKRFAYWNSRR